MEENNKQTKWYEKTYTTMSAAHSAIRTFGIRGEWRVVTCGARWAVQDRSEPFLTVGRLEVALCEDCGNYADWHMARRAHHGLPGCIWCGSARVSRCETEASR